MSTPGSGGRMNATVVSAALVGRWLAELSTLIGGHDPATRALPHMPFDTWTEATRERMAAIGNDLLVRLADAGVLTTDRVQLLRRVHRDRYGREVDPLKPLFLPPEPMPGPGEMPSCTCGVPWKLGTAHRADAPCWIPDWTPEEAGLRYEDDPDGTAQV